MAAKRTYAEMAAYRDVHRPAPPAAGAGGAAVDAPSVTVAVDTSLKRGDVASCARMRGAVAVVGGPVTVLPTNAEDAFSAATVDPEARGWGAMHGDKGTPLVAIASTPDMDRYAGGTLVPSTNGFLTAVRIAYNEHAPLRLRADDVWLQVRAR
jgi:hypothetical protein